LCDLCGVFWVGGGGGGGGGGGEGVLKPLFNYVCLKLWATTMSFETSVKYHEFKNICKIQ